MTSDTESIQTVSDEKQRPKSRKKIICTALILLAVFIIAASMTVTHILLKQNFSRGEYSKYTTDYRYDHYEGSCPRRNVSFKSGENTLQGYIYGGDNTKGLVVFAHGIGGGHEGYISNIVWLVDKGWCVFAYDATGSCTSEGEGTMGLPQSALDMDSALEYIESDEELSALPKVVMGHSWGGYAAAAVLNFDHDVKAAVSISGYAYPMDMIMEFADGMMGGASKLLYPFVWLDCHGIFGEYTNLSAVDGINKSGIPVLVIHGKEDTMIGFDRSSIISKADEITNPNVRYYPIDGKYSGHNSIFYSEEALDYMEELDEQLDGISAGYDDGEVPDEVLAEFFDGIDREKANGLNLTLMEKINSFFSENIRA